MAFFSHLILTLSTYTIASCGLGIAVRTEHFNTDLSQSSSETYVQINDNNTSFGTVLHTLLLSLSVIINLIVVVIILFCCYAFRSYQPWRYVSCRCVCCGLGNEIRQLLASIRSVEATSNNRTGQERGEEVLELYEAERLRRHYSQVV
jgi:hypothetical protein